MQRLNLVVVVSGLCLVFAGACSSNSSSSTDGGSGGAAATGGSGGGAVTDAGTGGSAVDAPAGNDSADGAPTDGNGGDAALSAEAMRGKYMVGVLGCAGCHTPKMTGTTMPDPTMTLAGVDCFVSAPGCLSSGNLTPDKDTGLGNFTDQAIMDAFRMGKDPDPAAAGKFLFARMPYYTFANLSDDDAKAIVAYLRALPAVKHAVKEATTPFDQAPTTPEWTPVDPTKLPAPGTGALADAMNGKYMATLMCVGCHSGDAAGTPKHIAEATAFQGGQSNTFTGGDAMMMFQSANLTPDMTGIMGWTAMDVTTAIKMAKDKMGKTLCAPMRANTAITDGDATAIADYLLSLPPAAHMITACGGRM